MKKTTKLILAVTASALPLLASAAEARAVTPAAEAVRTAAEAAKPAVTLESATAFLPDVLAEVNGKKILKKEMLDILQGVSAEELASCPPQMLSMMLASQAERLVDHNVMLEMAKKAGYVPSAELVKKKMDDIYHQKFSQAQKDQFAAVLKAQGKTYEQVLNDVAKDPMEQAKYAIGSFIDKVVKDAEAKDPVTDADVEKYYRDNQKAFEKPSNVTVSHILAISSETDMETREKLSPEEFKKRDTAAKAKIEKIYAQLKQGAKFEDLAAKESECPSGKATKGKLPAFSATGVMEAGGAMDPTFTKAAFALEKQGQISDIVKTPFGYHILRLEEKKPAQYIALDEIKDQIKAQLKNEKIEKTLKSLMDTAKKEMNVKTFFSIPAMPGMTAK